MLLALVFSKGKLHHKAKKKVFLRPGTKFLPALLLFPFRRPLPKTASSLPPPAVNYLLATKI